MSENKNMILFFSLTHSQPPQLPNLSQHLTETALGSITNTMNMNMGKLWEMVQDREAQCAAVSRCMKQSDIRVSNWTTTSTEWKK